MRKREGDLVRGKERQTGRKKGGRDGKKIRKGEEYNS